jgi:type II secretory pathway predicted ATPase ExeA
MTMNPPDQPSATALPPTDLLDDGAVWTPEIERLLQAVAEQIRLDQPGMIVSGPQRSGKSRACDYLIAVLSETLGYPVAAVQWTIPCESSKTTRLFFQERMLQSGSNAIQHRDLAVIRNRFFNHLAELTTTGGAKRLVIVIDEAQNLDRAEYSLLVFIFNELERRRLRPFVLLIGQPELNGIADQWMAAGAQQMVGRFSTRNHEYRGIRLDDLEQVLEGFDDESDGVETCASYRTSPSAFADGWRLTSLGPLMRDAIRQVAAAQNVQEEVYLPMQYLRSCLLAILYRIFQSRQRPESFSSADAIACVRSSNFASVLQYYVRRSGTADVRAMSGVPGDGR